jgi:hypothetical protein
MRVLIADDNRRIRRSIAGLLAADKSIEVCGEASHSSETLKKGFRTEPGSRSSRCQYAKNEWFEHCAAFEATTSFTQDSHH